MQAFFPTLNPYESIDKVVPKYLVFLLERVSIDREVKKCIDISRMRSEPTKAC